MNRALLDSAAVTFLLACFTVAQVAFQTSLYDYRFGLVYLSTGGLGAAMGLAFARSTRGKWARLHYTGWLTAAAIVAMTTVAVSLLVPFGTTPTFLLLSLAPAAVTVMATLAISASFGEGSPPAAAGVATLAGAAIAATLATPWLIGRIGGPLQLSAIAAIALGLITFTRGTGRAAKASGICSAILVLISIQAPQRYLAPPFWTADAGSPSKVLYQEAGRRGPATHLSSRWVGFTRTDIAAYKAIRGDLLWLFINGDSAGLMPAGGPRGTDAGWLRRQFPLITLALRAGQPEEVLVINPGGGLEVKMALDAGVRHLRTIEGRAAMGAIMTEGKEPFGGLADRPEVTLTTGNVRESMNQAPGRYDQIYLSIPHGQPGGWGAHHLHDSYLYTREAFAAYWDHLKPGGMLVLLAAEEALYIRALLTLWEALQGYEGQSGDSPADHGWGFQMASLTPRLAPYQYLLMVKKGSVGADERNRIDGLVTEIRTHGLPKDSGLSPLFGPGIEAKRGYKALHAEQGLPVARAVLHRMVSWKLQKNADLASATDLRPLFFQVVHDLHPFLKWLLGGILIAQICVFLVPVGEERRLDHPDSGDRPPLPVVLGYFAATTMAAVLTAIMVACHTAPLTGSLDRSLVAVVATMLIGGVVNADYLRRRAGKSSRSWGWLISTLCASVAAAGGILLLAPGAGTSWLGPLRTLIPALAALPSGLLFAHLLVLGMHHLSRALPSLTPWAWGTVGLSGVSGTVAALWIAQYRGWAAVWLTSTGAHATALAIGAWTLWLARRHGEPNAALPLQ